MRITYQHQVRTAGMATWRPITDLIACGGAIWCGRVTCFTPVVAQMPCTLLLQWHADTAEPWILMTDLASEVAESAGYGMRAWVEARDKDLKRGG